MSEPIVRECAVCAKPFLTSAKRIAEGKGKLCSRACRRRRVQKVCGHCGASFEVTVSQERIGEGRYCKRSCRSADQPARFWAKVNKNGPTPAHAPELGPCWLWTASTGGRESDQRGTAYWNGKTVVASRVAWIVTHGEIPRGAGYHGTCVLHRCDNGLCCNPSHLFLGTNEDNMRDMVAKRRAAQHAGVDNGRARLTEADVIAIRQARANGVTRSRLAAAYGVTPENIGAIANGKTWRHVRAPQSKTPDSEEPGASPDVSSASD
jgi:hypothetical protein